MSKTMLRWALLAAVAVAWSVRPAPLPRALREGTDTPPAAAPRVAATPPDRATDAGRRAVSDTRAGALPTITWGDLQALDIRTGDAGALRALHGQRVRIAGFVVPLDDFQEEMAEFLLVPYYGACVHTPPPPANQLIFARTTGPRIRAEWWRPVWLEGTLLITPYRSVYGEAGFRMSVQRVLPFNQE
jgi:hypothetical protein